MGRKADGSSGGNHFDTISPDRYFPAQLRLFRLFLFTLGRFPLSPPRYDPIKRGLPSSP
ncbi:hypothetical protein CLOLEP_03706 [[Clostridium] leptum DSM 753]|uniref:Uncharacterized protein n=1 Tax=[Clostridium] leptum DSM 753 TaxID=428125 RepID=A7VYM8_9FIRM|nr:hypothetical protein CLOLEP_03706 [[Clostridium] leptum DSM 753]